MRSIDTLVVGGGQAGLASSYHLRRRGVDHVVLEAGRIGESWRSRRWDSFTLVSPNWMIALPDLQAGVGGSGDPDGYLPRAEIVGMLAAWAAALAAPVYEGVTVTSVTRDPGGCGFVVETTDGPWRAGRVIAATGVYRTPTRPPFAADLSASIAQVDATAYRNPEALAPGSVLVVGSGQSGCQVVEDLLLAGRDVYLSVGSAGRLIRRYRGRDCFRWLDAIGFFELTEADLEDRAAAGRRTRTSPVPAVGIRSTCTGSRTTGCASSAGSRAPQAGAFASPPTSMPAWPGRTRSPRSSGRPSTSRSNAPDWPSQARRTRTTTPVTTGFACPSSTSSTWVRPGSRA
jgi:cation diffusion facilitator CzcD-associated flavoprotein CzcO